MENNIQWFKSALFGMFIHWGAYSVGGRGEWILNREHIPYDEYTEKYVDNFKAEKYNPSEWARLAKKAGMKYVVLTARHHDGFALWDTATTSFNSVNYGPRRDLVRPFVEAVRKEGLKVGLYFSGADWSHPDYPDPYCRDWPEGWKDEESRRRFEEYYKKQLIELMSNYGKIDILWYDGCIPEFSNGEEVNRLVKELQPGILINARNGKPYDFVNCERAIQPPRSDMPWEACQTLNNSWGYYPGDTNYKSARDVVEMLAQVAMGGGNLLLNVGPAPDGTIPEKQAQILLEVGRWLERNGWSLYNSARSPFSWTMFGYLTTKENKVFVHIFRETGKELCIAEIKNKVLDAYYVDTGEKVDFVQAGTRLLLRNLPVPLRDSICTTIAIEVEGKPEPIRPQVNFWVPGYNEEDL